MYQKAVENINIFLEKEIRLNSNNDFLLDGFNEIFPYLRLPIGTIAYMYKDSISYIVLNPDDFIMISKKDSNSDILKLFFNTSNLRLGYLTSNIDNPYQLAYIPIDNQIPITTLLDVSDKMIVSATNFLKTNSKVLIPYDETLRTMLHVINILIKKYFKKYYPIKFSFNTNHHYLQNNILYVPYEYITKIYNDERTINDSILLLYLDFKQLFNAL